MVDININNLYICQPSGICTECKGVSSVIVYQLLIICVAYAYTNNPEFSMVDNITNRKGVITIENVTAQLQLDKLKI